MNFRLLLLLSFGLIMSGLEASAQERVCVEEVAGVCLKFQVVEKPAARSQPAAPASEAERRERALGLSRDDRRDVQRGLRDAGYYRGALDGLFGPGTRRSIVAWQRANGLTADGYLTEETVGTLSRRDIAGAQAASSSLATAAELGDLISGLGCTSEVHGEPVRIVFRRDGGAAASAIDVSVFVTWTFENRRFCVLNGGRELTCFPIEMPITSANRDDVRDFVQTKCTTR